MRSTIVPGAIGLVCALIEVAATTSLARANCYETIGCSDGQYFNGSDLKQISCQSLWEVRNWIYKERGYCFKTPKTIAAFGSAGCLYDDVTQMPLNQFRNTT